MVNLVIVFKEGMDKSLLQSGHIVSLTSTNLSQLTYAECCQIEIAQTPYNVTLYMDNILLQNHRQQTISTKHNSDFA